MPKAGMSSLRSTAGSREGAAGGKCWQRQGRVGRDSPAWLPRGSQPGSQVSFPGSSWLLCCHLQGPVTPKGEGVGGTPAVIASTQEGKATDRV